MEDLVLELTDLRFVENEGVRRASARARLVYEPATPGQRDVVNARSWRFIAPIGPIEAEELRWYLEKFAIWPSEYFRERARKVEDALVQWGQLLYAAALPREHTANVMPWELLHDGDGFLFQGSKLTRVRRRLPNTRDVDVFLVSTPIRILLVTSRPEDSACAYIEAFIGNAFRIAAIRQPSRVRTATIVVHIFRASACAPPVIE